MDKMEELEIIEKILIGLRNKNKNIIDDEDCINYMIDVFDVMYTNLEHD